MSKNTQLRDVRSSLSMRPRGPGRRLSTEAKRRVALYAQRRATEGATLRQIAREVGLGAETVSRVLERTTRPALVPVRVVEDPQRAQVIVRGPGGLTIEGLGLEELAALLRELAC